MSGTFVMRFASFARLLAAAAVAVGLHAAGAAQAATIVGSCEDYDFVTRKFDGEPEPLRGNEPYVRVLRDALKVSAEPEGSPSGGELSFGDRVLVAKVTANSVQIRNESGTISGWVRRADVLCQETALIANRLERKAVIRTQAGIRGEQPRTVEAFRSPEAARCEGGCRGLSRFQLYMIAAESDTAVLLVSSNFVMHEATVLTGWVRKTDMFEWPWSVGLRISEDLVFADGPGTACAYFTPEEGDRDPAGTSCQRAGNDASATLWGGFDWFRSDLRMLVTRETERYYEVVAPVSGFGTGAGDARLRVEPGRVGPAPVETLTRRNHVDVFFAIDGTRSMGAWIDAIRGTASAPGVIQQINSMLRSKVATGSKFRFGFRVYRDTNGAQYRSSGGQRGGGIGEGLPLSGTDCDGSPETLAANAREFAERLAPVRAADNEGDDDYHENTLGGIEQAIKDMQGCPENTKILFVVGDAGFDPRKQASRQIPPLDPARLVQRFEESFKAKLLVFIRPPEDVRLRNTGDYYEAWNNFARQGTWLAEQLKLQQGENTLKTTLPWVLDLTAGATVTVDMLERLGGAVSATTDATALAEIAEDLRGGASLIAALNRLRNVRTDIPGIFWKLVETSTCEALGPACRTSIMEDVRRVYVRKDPRTVRLDIFMNTRQLEDWGTLLRQVTSPDGSVQDRRKRFVDTLVKSLTAIVREPECCSPQESFADYLRRAGALPASFKSPLLRYSIRQLYAGNPESIDQCELDRLMGWVQSSDQMLRHVRVSLQGSLVEYKLREAEPVAGCRLSEQGRTIPVFDGVPERRPWPPEGQFGMSSSFGLQETFYWIPDAYLP